MNHMVPLVSENLSKKRRFTYARPTEDDGEVLSVRNSNKSLEPLFPFLGGKIQAAVKRYVWEESEPFPVALTSPLEFLPKVV